MDKRIMKTYFDEISPWHDKWRKKNIYYHRELEGLLNFLVPKDASVLDIGCATGDLLAVINPLRGKGIDISFKTIATAKQKYPNFEFQVMDAESINLGEKYDYIILSNLVGFLSDIQQSFHEVYKVAHPESRIIITHYNHLWEPILRLAEALRLKMPNPPQNWLAPADIENLLYLENFEIIKRKESLLMPKYIPLISWFCNRYLAKLPLLKNLCLIDCIVAKPRVNRYTTDDNSPSVSIIVPARNERGNIESIVKRVPNIGSHTEIIFVEGHSRDNTLEEIGRIKKKYTSRDIKILTQDNNGKGDAVRKGFDHAHGDILMILDADLSVRPEDLSKFYEAITRGVGEFINGSRMIYPLEKQSMRLLNIVGNKFFSSMFSWLLEQRIKDTLCGTKVLWKTDYEKIKKGRNFFGEFDPFGDFDLLFGAAKLNLKIIDLPIRYQPRMYGKTNISRFSHGLLLMKMCLFAIRKIKFI